MRRRETFEIGEYYHVFNRGVQQSRIFFKQSDYQRFYDSLIFFNTEKPSWLVSDLREAGIPFAPDDEERLVDIVAYCINPNHFHLLLKENKQNGISTFMKKLCTGYAMYFNAKNERSGVVFQGRFKSVHIDSNDLLLYISAYVNCNSQVHSALDALKYPWCSFGEYANEIKGICEKDIILSQFGNSHEYKAFCMEKVVGMKERKEIDNTILES